MTTTRLLIGGRIHSPSAPDATAMAITGDTIVWVGADEPARALHPGADIVDLAGAFVAPAFVDPHLHTTALGLQLTGLDLSGARSGAQLLAAVREFAATSPHGLIWGHGWDETRWAQPLLPAAAELAAAAPGRLIYLTRVDAHSALVSPELAGRAPHNLAGVVSGDAHHAARAVALAHLAPAQLDTARRQALDHAAAQGIAAVHDCSGPDINGREDLHALRNLGHGVEVVGYWGEAVASPEQARELLAATGARGLAGDLFVDGSIGSRTAWLSSPYADENSTGTAYLSEAEIFAHLRACTAAKIAAGFHVIGDAAATAVAQAFARLAAETGTAAIAACGHRLEHAEMLSPPQLSVLASCGVSLSVQPLFDACWGGDSGMYATRLGRDRAATLNPFAQAAAAGLTLAIGSDAPATELSPWKAVQAAVHHRNPGHGISPRAAFTAATRGAWRAGGVRDGITGTLTPGAVASYAVWEAGDLVVAPSPGAVQRWSTDPRSRVPGLPALTPGSELPRCLATVHRGETIYAR